MIVEIKQLLWKRRWALPRPTRIWMAP